MNNLSIKLLLSTCFWLFFGSKIVLAKNISTSLFTNKQSPGSIAVGVAEGNYTIKGKATSLYSGHTDPGNHVTNRGFCSWNRAANISVAKADQLCLNSLQKHSQKIKEQMQDADIELQPHAIVNGTDIWNQSNSAGPEFVKQYKASLKLGLQGKAAYVWARVEAFRTAGGALDASGLFGICRTQSYYQQRLQGLRQDSELWRWQCIGLDQRRRVELISKTLKHYLGETKSVPPPQQSSTAVSIKVLDFSSGKSKEKQVKSAQRLNFASVKEKIKSRVKLLGFKPPSLNFAIIKPPSKPQSQSPSGTTPPEKSWSKQLRKTLSVGETVGKYKVTSPFGNRIHPVTKKFRFHGGVDLNTPHGTPVYALGKAESSTEVKCWYDKHGGGLVATMTSPSLPQWQFDLLHLSWCVHKTNGSPVQVESGKIAARVGNTGIGTGPHLHFQMRDRNTGKKISPMKGYLIWALQGKEPS